MEHIVKIENLTFTVSFNYSFCQSSAEYKFDSRVYVESEGDERPSVLTEVLSYYDTKKDYLNVSTAVDRAKNAIEDYGQKYFKNTKLTPEEIIKKEWDAIEFNSDFEVIKN